MSGITPLPLVWFRDMLGLRGLDVASFAASIGVARAHLSQVLNGHRSGGETWTRIRAGATDAEWSILLQLEHCATWNTAQLAKGDAAFVWELRVACGWCKASMGFKACNRSVAGQVSHGICPDCYTKQLAALDQLAARQEERDLTPDSFAPVEISCSDHETKSALTPAAGA